MVSNRRYTWRMAGTVGRSWKKIGKAGKMLRLFTGYRKFLYVTKGTSQVSVVTQPAVTDLEKRHADAPMARVALVLYSRLHVPRKNGLIWSELVRHALKQLSTYG